MVKWNGEMEVDVFHGVKGHVLEAPARGRMWLGLHLMQLFRKSDSS